MDRRLSAQLPRIGIEVTAVALAIGILGWVNLPMPLHGDAALYQLGAKALADGEMLYRDFWDLKQPGIYLFHWLAGSLFGFTETGLHAFELLYLTAFSILQVIVLRRYLHAKWIAPATPAGDGWKLLRAVERMAPDSTGHSPFCTALLLTRPTHSPARALALTACWSSWCGCRALQVRSHSCCHLAVCGELGRRPQCSQRRGRGAPGGAHHDGPPWRSTRHRRSSVLVTCASGTSVVHLGVSHLDATRLGGPGRAPPGSRALLDRCGFCISFAPQLVLACFARLGWRGLRDERVFVLSLVWMVTGGLSILIEPFAGWQFDFLMLAAPTGILAVRGLDGILGLLGSALTNRQQARCSGTAFWHLPPFRRATCGRARRTDLVVHRKLAFSADFAYQRKVSRRYEEIWQTTAFLREQSSASGPIYVFGDPLIHTLSQRPLAEHRARMGLGATA